MQLYKSSWRMIDLIKKIALLSPLFILLLVLPRVQSIASMRRSPVVIAVEKAGPAVVNISTRTRERVRSFFPFAGDDFFKDFFPDLFSREYTRTSLGSGVIIDGVNGYIVTNHHVVARASEIKVITTEKKEYLAKILGTDPRSDLAVLQIKPEGKMPELGMGNSDDLMIGETVIAIGNPFGLSHTVTTGVVSAVDRSVRADEHVYRNFIQTDASINPGNSGGPLLNVEGELIGINTAIYQKAQGIGFAIPINKARRIVMELLKAGEVRFPWLGLDIQELTRELRAYFGLPGRLAGVLISDVDSKGPGAEGSLQRGDIITKLGETPISAPEDYYGALAEYTPSDSFQMTVFHNGVDRRVIIKPTQFPLDRVQDLVYKRLGIRVAEVKGTGSGQFGEKGGVVIEEVRADSEAARIGLERGDLILRINEKPMPDMETFKESISRSHHLPSLTLLVQRGPYGYSLTLPF